MSSSSSSPSSYTIKECHRRLEQAAVAATELVERFAQESPYDNSTSNNNPWKHPDQIFQQLNQAREQLVNAWKDLEEVYPKKNGTTQPVTTPGDDETSSSPSLTSEQCRILYMDMITDAFGDTLEYMRRNNQLNTDDDDLQVEILVDCLQSGLELLTTQEQELILAPLQDTMDEDEIEAKDDDDIKGSTHGETLTIQEERQRAMGLWNM